MPRQDDPNIANDEWLWRRIIPAWLHRDPDGTVRPASIAFIDRRSGEVSVHRASLTTTDKVLAGRPEESIVAVKAELPRSLGYALVADPTPDDTSHALICPPLKSGSGKKADARKMADAAQWVVPPKIS